MKCNCGYEFDFDGFRNFGLMILEDGRKVIVCPECGAQYEEAERKEAGEGRA